MIPTRLFPRSPHEHCEPSPIPFPAQPHFTEHSSVTYPAMNVREASMGSPSDVLHAFDTVSRRINDLARELNCLGYFDEDSDRPRAA